MNRFYVSPECVDAARNRIHVSGAEAHHIIDVMRMGENDKVVIFDGTGSQYTGFIEKVDRKRRELLVRIIKAEMPVPERMPEIYLAQAIPKKGKMDYIVEKSVELGVHAIIPVITDRTLVRPDRGSSLEKPARWRKIASETSKQCGRAYIPAVADIARFDDIMALARTNDISLMACLSENTVSLKKAMENFVSGKILVMIGPEGDFTPEEAQMASENSFKLVSLGKNILKSDTAGLFVLSAIRYIFAL